MAKHPSPSDWKAKDSVLKAAIKGFNVLSELPKLLSQEYVWLKDFDFGFFTEDDIPEKRSLGWTFLNREHFEIDNFNQAIGLAHGLTDDGSGNVKWRNNYIMICPKDFRKRAMDIRHKSFEDQFKKETQTTRYVAPGSQPQHEEASTAAFEEFQVINQPTGRRKKSEA